VNSSPSGLVRMSPAPDPSRHDDPSVNRVYDFGIASSAGASIGGPSSSGLLAIKSAKIWPRIDDLFDGLVRDYYHQICLEVSPESSRGMTALTTSLAAQRVLKKRSGFSVDLDKNLFKLASFPLRLCASFSIWGDRNFITASTFSGQALIPLMLTMWPRNAPSFVIIHLQRCSAMDLGTPVISVGFQENISKLSLSKLQSSILPFSDRLPPIVTICFGYSGWIATLIPSAAVGYWGGGPLGASATILHSAGIMVLLRPIIPLYGDEDLTTMKFIRALIECFPSPKDTISDICPKGQDISPLNPIRGVVAGTVLFFTSRCNLLKQCSYNTSEADPPSIYMRWMRCFSTSASITIGFSCPLSPLRGGK
ncbi:hypothetical protein Tco_0477277, partial [Tanacetum coccineum]